jgi:hypothetical protein
VPAVAGGESRNPNEKERTEQNFHSPKRMERACDRPTAWDDPTPYLS